MFQPSAIDNALSTMQILHKLINQINTVIDEVNSIDSKANEYTDEQIELLHRIINDELSEVESNLNNLIKSNSDDIVNIKTELIELHNNIKKLNKDIKSNTDLIFSNYNVLILKIAELKDYIDSVINGLNIKVFSPVTGYKTDIQNALNDIYNLYQIDFGNVNLTYIKKLLQNIVVINNVNYNLLNIKFKHVKDLKTSLSMFSLYKNTEVKIDVAVKQTFKDSHSYSFYQIIDIIRMSILSDVTGSTQEQVLKAISNILYSSLGFYYTEYMPKNRSWI
jgi:DNA-binding transcriptional MerR regulator